MKTRILIADDHAMLREGMRNLLEKEKDFELVGEAADGEEAVRLAAKSSSLISSSWTSSCPS